MSRAQTPTVGSSTLARSDSRTGQPKKDESILDKLSTLGRKKKIEEAENVAIEGIHAIDLPGSAAMWHAA